MPTLTSHRRAGCSRRPGPTCTAACSNTAPQHKAVAVDGKTLTVKFEVQDEVKADVLNVLPPMRAGALAVQSGLASANARWCTVNFQTFESTAAKDIHVVGDSILAAALMPKSRPHGEQPRQGRRGGHRRRIDRRWKSTRGRC